MAIPISGTIKVVKGENIMTITIDIKNQSYINLIKYAMSVSDAFMLVSLNKPLSSFNTAKKIYLIHDTLPSLTLD